MDIKKSALLGAVLAGSVTMSLSAFAGGYVGASIGEAEYTAPALADGSMELDSFSLEAGYYLNENWAVEVSYEDLGSISDGFTELSFDGYTLAIVGSLPLNDSFALTATVGTLFWNLGVEDAYDDVSADSSDMFYSVGAKYAANESIDLTLNFDFFDLESVIDVDTVSLGARFKF